MTKYPWGSEAGNSKFGFYGSEKSKFAEVAEGTGLIADEQNEKEWCRHPLAYLVEAADDICNPIVDFEDAARLEILDYKDVLRQFRVLGDAMQMPRNGIAGEKKAKVEILSRTLLPRLTEVVAESFIKYQEQILEGKFQGSLIDTLDTKTTKALKAIKKKLAKDVYTSRKVVEIEAPAFRVLDTLLEKFVRANEDVYFKRKNASKEHKLLMDLVPTQFRSGERRADRSHAYDRVLDILDFVSGMTDIYAVSLYKTITGISLPGV
jgi:dGTPase